MRWIKMLWPGKSRSRLEIEIKKRELAELKALKDEYEHLEKTIYYQKNGAILSIVRMPAMEYMFVTSENIGNHFIHLKVICTKRMFNKKIIEGSLAFAKFSWDESSIVLGELVVKEYYRRKRIGMSLISFIVTFAKMIQKKSIRGRIDKIEAKEQNGIVGFLGILGFKYTLKEDEQSITYSMDL